MLAGLSNLFRSKSKSSPRNLSVHYTSIKYDIPADAKIGIVAGNGSFPLACAREARDAGHQVVAVCHQGETSSDIEDLVDYASWIRVGELGHMIRIFKEQGVGYAAFAGGISRVKSFSDVKLDLRGSAMMLRLRSTKDDVIMRGMAEELLSDGIEVFPCTHFLSHWICPEGCLTKRGLSSDEEIDISTGIAALKALSAEDIGQLVVVRSGVIVAVEAVEGSDATILRGGQLGGRVVVKCAKTTQDMRFDVPTAGLKTLDVMEQVGARVLALEAGRSIIMDKDNIIREADKRKISIVGVPPLVDVVLGGC